MRDLIVMNIKQFIILLQERGTIINTQCVVDKKKKTTILPPTDIKQEVETAGSSSMFTSDMLDVVINCSETICHNEDFVPEMNYMFTVNEISTSVVSSLIHVSKCNVYFPIQLKIISLNLLVRKIQFVF